MCRCAFLQQYLSIYAGLSVRNSMLESICLDFPLLMAITFNVKTSLMPDVLAACTTHPAENTYVVH